MRAIVIGANGQIGSAICLTMLQRGFEVVACHRGRLPLREELKAHGCKEIVGDRHSSKDVARELAKGADILVDVVPMAEADADQLVSASDQVDALVAISSAAVYEDERGRSIGSAAETGFPDFPDKIEETHPTVAPDAGSYAGRKVSIERKLLEHSKAPSTILRAGAVHGRNAADLREVWFLKRILDRRPFVPLAYDGRSRFHTCAADTLALAAVGAAAARYKGILNVADEDAPSVAEIGAILMTDVAPMELRPFAGPPVNGVGRSPWSVPDRLCLDTTKLNSLIGPLRPYRHQIRDTAAWALEQLAKPWEKVFPKLAAYPFPLFDYAAEDQLFASRSGVSDRSTR